MSVYMELSFSSPEYIDRGRYNRIFSSPHWSLETDCVLFQMAIFGVKGKVLTPEYRHLNFELQHAFDLSMEQGYRLVLSLFGDRNRCNDIVRVEGDRTDVEYFDQVVQHLTSQFANDGPQKALEHFLKRGYADGNRSHHNQNQ